MDTTKYIPMLYALLSKAGVKEYKDDIAFSITKSRTPHISQMTQYEQMEMKKYLESLIQEKDNDRLRAIRTLIGLCYHTHKIAPHLSIINNGKVDYEKLNKKIQARIKKNNINECSKEDIKTMIIYFKLLIKNYGNQ